MRLEFALVNTMLITLSVWDWSKRRRLCHFCNGNPRGTNITALEIVNQDIGGIIVSGSGKLLSLFMRNLWSADIS